MARMPPPTRTVVFVLWGRSVTAQGARRAPLQFDAALVSTQKRKRRVPSPPARHIRRAMSSFVSERRYEVRSEEDKSAEQLSCRHCRWHKGNMDPVLMRYLSSTASFEAAARS